MILNLEEAIQINNDLFYHIPTGEAYSATTRRKLVIKSNLIQIKSGTRAYRWSKVVWEHFNGPIPKHYAVKLKKPNDYRIENLYLKNINTNLSPTRPACKNKFNKTKYRNLETLKLCMDMKSLENLAFLMNC